MTFLAMTRSPRPRLTGVLRARARLAAVLLAVVAAPLAAAPVAGQRTFPSADAAVEALFDAVISGDPREMRPLFGADTPRIAPSGDEEAIARRRDGFARHWAAGHALVPQDDGHLALVLGGERWTYPVPLTRVGADRWVFDTRAGIQEIQRRRVARNELATIAALHAFVDAQNRYALADRDGDGVAEYAWRVDSRPGRRDGLHWVAAPGESEPPLGDEAAEAAAQVQRGRPHHGYRFRLLTSQGPSARGGARDYRVDGRLLGGFAAIAVPHVYGRTGLHTFLINHDNVVWSRDLGPNTSAVAARIGRFDPGAGWRRE